MKNNMNEFKKLAQQLKAWNKKESAIAYYWYNNWKISPKISQTEPEAIDESDDYRKKINGERNKHNLEKARMYAELPQAQVKKQRSELRKGLRGEL